MVLWLRQTAHDQEIVGSNPGTVYWMDVTDASYYIKQNIKNKGSRMGHTKKKYIKKTYCNAQLMGPHQSDHNMWLISFTKM